MTDDMTLVKIPWRPFQNSKLPKQSIGLGRQTLSACPNELLKGQRGEIVKKREKESLLGLEATLCCKEKLKELANIIN